MRMIKSMDTTNEANPTATVLALPYTGETKVMTSVHDRTERRRVAIMREPHVLGRKLVIVWQVGDMFSRVTKLRAASGRWTQPQKVYTHSLTEPTESDRDLLRAAERAR